MIPVKKLHDTSFYPGFRQKFILDPFLEREGGIGLGSCHVRKRHDDDHKDGQYPQYQQQSYAIL
jgi:hypothetical protein